MCPSECLNACRQLAGLTEHGSASNFKYEHIHKGAFFVRGSKAVVKNKLVHELQHADDVWTGHLQQCHNCLGSTGSSTSAQAGWKVK